MRIKNLVNEANNTDRYAEHDWVTTHKNEEAEKESVAHEKNYDFRTDNVCLKSPGAGKKKDADCSGGEYKGYSYKDLVVKKFMKDNISDELKQELTTLYSKIQMVLKWPVMKLKDAIKEYKNLWTPLKIFIKNPAEDELAFESINESLDEISTIEQLHEELNSVLEALESVGIGSKCKSTQTIKLKQLLED